jgi:hypothetical protein
MIIYKQYKQKTSSFYNILDRVSLCEPKWKPKLRVQFSL